MKRIKTMAVLLLAIAFLAPTFACQSEALLPEHSSTESESFEGGQVDSSPESSTPPESSAPPSLEESTPPATEPSTPSTPSTPTTPSTPSTPSTPQTPTVSDKAQYIRCTGDNVNIRSGAGTNYTVLGSAQEGTMYAVIGKSGSWYKTYYRNKIAYIYAEYASVLTLEKAEQDSIESVIEEGYKLIGVPYVYGAVRLHDGKGKLLSGFSAQKFDCSSLIQYIFYKGAGTLLNVNTRTQVTQGKYVKKSDLQRGDCIFFTNAERQHNKGIERIGHVALYLGNNYILHTASDYARIEKMSSQRWGYYVEARRFL